MALQPAQHVEKVMVPVHFVCLVTAMNADRTENEPDLESSGNTEASADSCPLLELPAEIRNMIYTHVLIDDDIVFFDENESSQPALLQTCRQVREEAAAIFYYHKGDVFSLMVEDL